MPAKALYRKELVKERKFLGFKWLKTINKCIINYEKSRIDRKKEARSIALELMKKYNDVLIVCECGEFIGNKWTEKFYKIFEKGKWIPHELVEEKVYIPC